VLVAGTNSTAVGVSNLISGLSAATLYHFRLVATNSVGTATGGDLTFTTSFQCVTPPAGLAYWWPGQGNALDIWGTNNGTLQGGVTFTNGKVGQAFNLDGATGFISTSLLITNPQTFSLSLWFRTATTNGGVLISFDSSQSSAANGSQFDRNIYMDDAGALHFGVWNSGPQQINSVAGYNDNNWHQVVGGLSASTGLSLYVDGVLAGNNPAVTYASETYNGYWRFGEDNLNNWPNQPASHFFQGQIDEVAVFNTALASQDVANIYAVGSAGMCKP
jgi:Concanavalin A-like lectin/glucanases superfamily